MEKLSRSLTALTDHEVIAEVKRLAARERRVTANLIASLAEFDERKLYLGEGCSSLFTYCTQVLHLSEHAAYGRIEAARAARRFPLIFDLLSDGSINLTTVTLLAAHLTAENHRALLEESRHQSKRVVEQIVARLHPHPNLRSSVRKLPAPHSAKTLQADRRTDEPPDQRSSAPPAVASVPARPALSRRWRQSGSGFSSPSRAKRTRNSVGRRICCVIAFPLAIWPQCSTVR